MRWHHSDERGSRNNKKRRGRTRGGDVIVRRTGPRWRGGALARARVVFVVRGGGRNTNDPRRREERSPLRGSRPAKCCGRPRPRIRGSTTTVAAAAVGRLARHTSSGRLFDLAVVRRDGQQRALLSGQRALRLAGSRSYSFDLVHWSLSSSIRFDSIRFDSIRFDSIRFDSPALRPPPRRTNQTPTGGTSRRSTAPSRGPRSRTAAR